MEVPEEEKKREKLIEELFQTEETYLDNLKLVYEVGGRFYFLASQDALEVMLVSHSTVSYTHLTLPTKRIV